MTMVHMFFIGEVAKQEVRHEPSLAGGLRMTSSKYPSYYGSRLDVFSEDEMKRSTPVEWRALCRQLIQLMVA